MQTIDYIIRYFKKRVFLFSLLIITLYIASQSISWNSWLSGWDTLHPEFNFSLHIFRSIFGVWREDQGLGALAAHAHMSDLPRILLMWIFSAILPQQLLRQVVILICFILGPLGIYRFMQAVLGDKNDWNTHASAFLAGTSYIFNLATVQHFIVVFEMFAYQYAAIGWLFLYCYKILRDNTRKNWLAFSIITFLSTPMAYASQLWIAYFAGLVLFLSVMVWKKVVEIRIVLGILVLTILINGYWLFPNIYFVLSDSTSTISNSQINRMFSDESFFHNAHFGKISDVVIQKNFLFNWQVYDFSTHSFVDLLFEWKNHINSMLVIIIGYAFFGMSLLGISVAVKKKQVAAISLIPVFLISIFMLVNMNPPVSWLFDYLRDVSNIFREGFRTPFTKFSILLLFSTSIFFGAGLNWIISKSFIKNINHVKTIGVVFILISQLTFAWPILSEGLISSKLHVDIPREYFELFEYSKSLNDLSRIAILPAFSYQGWEYYDWGYQGAGFIWFGLKQPVLVRDFDRWSSYNESFYIQLSNSIHNENVGSFVNTLDKYKVGYIVYDDSMMYPNDQLEDTVRKKTIQMLESSHFRKVWSSGNLSLYRISNHDESLLSIPDDYQEINADTAYIIQDHIYENIDSYIDAADAPTVYPFIPLLRTTVEEMEYSLFPKFVQQYDQLSSKYHLHIPPLSGETYVTPTKISYTDKDVFIEFIQSAEIEINSVVYSLPTPEPISFTPQTQGDKLFIQIGDRQVLVSRGMPIETQLELETGKNIFIEYFNAEDVLVIDERWVIDEKDVYIHQIPSSIWNNLLDEKIFEISEPVSSASIKILSTAQTIDLNDTMISNCENQGRGKVLKEIRTEEIEYISDKYGFGCEKIELSDISSKGSYLLRINGEGVSGRGIKLFVSDNEQSFRWAEDLLPTGPYDVSRIIHGSDVITETLYLHLENQSFGSLTTNRLKSIEIYNLPLQQIGSIFLSTQSDTSMQSEAELIHQWKFGTHQYGAMVDAKKESLLVLPQAFDRGWIAIITSPGQFQILNHREYNSWSNSWLIPEGSYAVAIIFVPQLLSFTGFFTLVISFTLVIGSFRRKGKVSGKVEKLSSLIRKVFYK